MLCYRVIFKYKYYIIIVNCYFNTYIHIISNPQGEEQSMSSSKKRRCRTNQQQAEWLFRKHKNRNLLASPGVHEFILVLDHLKADYNIGKIFRSADAFGAHAIHLVGIEQFDPASARGSFKWVPAKFYTNITASYLDLKQQGYRIFVLESASEQALVLNDVILPQRSAFIVGHEAFGHSFDRQQYPDIEPLTIVQYGRVESLNVSVAASLVMYEYVRQYIQK